MEWIIGLNKEFFSDQDSIKRYMKIRFGFACDVFQALQQGLEVENDPGSIKPIVYGVTMSNKSIYIGQSSDYKRRIKDLPIGESHHLAKTIPPELWDKIIVIKWIDILKDQNALDVVSEVKENLVNKNKELRKKSEDKKDKKAIEYVGKAFEYKLQSDLIPLFNTGKKTTDDGTIAFKNAFKASPIIKQTLPYIEEYYPKLKEQYDLINKDSQDALIMGRMGYKSQKNYGCAVFPSFIWEKNKKDYFQKY